MESMSALLANILKKNVAFVKKGNTKAKKDCLVVYYETLHVECSSPSVFVGDLKKTVRRRNR